MGQGVGGRLELTEKGKRGKEQRKRAVRQNVARELHTTGKWTVFIEHASSSAVPSVESCRDDYRGSGQGRGDPALTRQNQTPGNTREAFTKVWRAQALDTASCVDQGWKEQHPQSQELREPTVTSKAPIKAPRRNRKGPETSSLSDRD